MQVLEKGGLSDLFSALNRRGFSIVGPTERDGAIVLDTLERPDRLPWGRVARDGPGTCRVDDEPTGAAFSGGPGAHPWKRFLYPPAETVLAVTRDDDGIRIGPPAPVSRLALFGVRPCDVAALARLDGVLVHGPHPDERYRARRDAAFVVAVECTDPGPACFCGSMGSGPRARLGFDLALVEIATNGRHVFLARPGTELGREVLDEVGPGRADAAEIAAAEAALDAAAARTHGAVDEKTAERAVLGDTEHGAWERVAARCMSCGNCTQSCPTCFCSTMDDLADLEGTAFERVRRSESCFAPDFSYMHGGSVRGSVRARYRHWLRHKFGTWHAQFGAAGCVGCGRCIVWCPAGIDVREEVRALLAASYAAVEEDDDPNA